MGPRKQNDGTHGRLENFLVVVRQKQFDRIHEANDAFDNSNIGYAECNATVGDVSARVVRSRDRNLHGVCGQWFIDQGHIRNFLKVLFEGLLGFAFQLFVIQDQSDFAIALLT